MRVHKMAHNDVEEMGRRNGGGERESCLSYSVESVWCVRGGSMTLKHQIVNDDRPTGWLRSVLVLRRRGTGTPAAASGLLLFFRLGHSNNRKLVVGDEAHHVQGKREAQHIVGK